MRLRTLTLALALTLAITGTAARADQQAPTQHSPAFQEYRDVPDSADSTHPEDRQTSSVALRWQAMPQANHYLLKISHDPDQTDIVYTVDTINLSHDTPELTPGAYYYSVTGLEGTRHVGQTQTEPFVIGKPVSLTGKKERLIAPTIIGPKHMDLFPTYGYVRVAWESVDGARGYRFRLWNEDKVRENQRWKRETPPRWITEVKQPWIEIHDAPYTSYMYLESGTYRWDVAAVDKDGGYIGETAQGYFKVSRQWFLKTSEVFIRVDYIYAPNAWDYQDSSVTGLQAKMNSPSHRLNADADWWFWRQLGANFGGGFQSVDARSGSNPLSDVLLFIHANADLMYRTYLSTVPWGWTLTFSAGLGMQEIPQIDVFSNSLHVSRPKEVGPNLGIRIAKHWDGAWESEFRFNTLIPAFTVSSPTGTTETGTTFIGDAQLKMVYNWTYHFATEFGLGAQLLQARYTPNPYLARSNVLIEDINFIIGLRFNYYPPPDNTNYYPDKPGSYYPSDRTAGYYKSEEQNMDDTHSDSTSWQRWRPR